MTEVWILKVKYAPDWPFPGGWAQAGVFTSLAKARTKLRKLQMKDSRITEWDLRACLLDEDLEDVAA